MSSTESKTDTTFLTVSSFLSRYPDVPADCPYRPRPRVLEQVLQELVGGLGQVLVDGVEVDRLPLAPMVSLVLSSFNA